ncbi:tetratricopeptide repeat protein [Sphingobium aromaticiconvertens]|uniref:tetratricopeptide repeat protein n=1 Tax=Sphingobium aromaticiconvertens TaxID=365341 RepID=UPI003016AA5C
MRAIVAFTGFVLAGALATGAVAAPEQAGSDQASFHQSISVKANAIHARSIQPSQIVGVTDGGLAATALMQGDFRGAATRLKAKSPDAINDPARLINLGNAYAGMGRYAKAHEIYTSARYAPDTMLVLADGSEAFSRDIARRALGRLGTNFAAR